MSQVLSPWGYLPDGWQLSTIKDEMIEVTDYVANGSFASLRENVAYKDREDYAVLIRTADYHNNFEGSFVYIDENAYKFLSKSMLFGGEIIISNVGSVGEVFKCPNLNKHMSLAPNAIMVKLKGNNDFYYYWFKSRIGQQNILNLVSGSAQPKFNKTHFKAMEIPVPPISVQDKIADILSVLDDKINNNRKICKNLEAQAQALFKHWFVDFAPFKDGKFVESELGLIPEGWKVAKIKDIPHTLNTGKRPKGGAITSGVPSIGAEQLKGLCNYDYTKTKYISEEFSKSIPKGKVMGYEVYLNRVGGKPGDYIQNTTMFGEGYPYENCYLNDHVFKLDFMQNRGYNVFIYFTFLTSRIQKYLNACGGKAAIPVINKQNIDDIYVFSPENEYVIKFGDSILPMINMIFKIGVESARLATLRDTLLPKLMSGQIKL